MLTLDQTWALAQAWYRDRMDADFHGWSPAAAEAVFRRLGLTGPFWSQ